MVVTKDVEVDYKKVIELYHENCDSFPRVFKLSDARKAKIRIRLEEMKNDYSILETIFKKMGDSKFLKGDNKNGWKASFDWLFENEKNWVKVIEGNYESNQAPAVLDKVTVDLEAEGDCWLEASADGKELFAGILHAKESKHFEAKDKLIVKYGNIGVVRIKVNGEAVDLKGEHGVAVKTYLRNAPAQPAAAAKAEEAAPKSEPETKAAPAAAVEEAAPQPAAVAPAPKAEGPKPQAEVKPAEPQQPQAAGEAKADKKK